MSLTCSTASQGRAGTCSLVVKAALLGSAADNGALFKHLNAHNGLFNATSPSGLLTGQTGKLGGGGRVRSGSNLSFF